MLMMIFSFSLQIEPDAQKFHVLTYTWWDDARTDFAHIEWVVVASTSFCIRMDKCWVFPCLRKAPVVEEDISFFELIEHNAINNQW